MPQKKLLAFVSIVLILTSFIPAAIFHAQGDSLDPLMVAIIDAAMGSLSQKLGKPQSRAITAWYIEGDAFNDASLDCPTPGKTYEQKIARGYRIRLTAPSQTDLNKNFDYQYRSLLDGSQLFECTPQGPGPNIQVVLPTPVPVVEGADGTAVPTATQVQPQQAQVVVKESKLLSSGSAIPVEVRWTADNKVIAVLIPADIKSAQIVDLETKAVLLSINLKNPASSARLSPDGKLLAVAQSGEMPAIFDATTGQKIVDMQNTAKTAKGSSDIAWNGTGTVLVELSADQVIGWDAKTGNTKFSAATQGGMLAWSPDDKLLIANYGPTATQVPLALDAADGKQKFTLDAVASDVQNVVWGPNARSVALVGKDDSIAIFSGTNGARIRNITGHSIQWSPDGSKLASATNHHATNIYDTSKGTIITTFDGGPTIQNVIAFSPDGNRIATGDNDGSVRIWEVATGKLLVQLDGQQQPIYQVKWKSDGTQLLSFGGDGTIRLWNVPQS